MLGGGAWPGETRAEAAVRGKAEEGVRLGLEASGGVTCPSLWVCCSGRRGRTDAESTSLQLRAGGEPPVGSRGSVPHPGPATAL